MDVSRLAKKAQIRHEWVLKGSFKKGLFITKSQKERKHQGYSQLAGTLIFRVFASEAHTVCKYAKGKAYFVRFFQNVLAKATNTLGHIRSSGSTPKAIKTRAPYHSSQDSGEHMANIHPRIEWQIEDSKSKCKICWCLDCVKTMKNTAKVCHAAGGAKPPKNTISNTKKSKRETAVSQGLINFVLYMYHQLTSVQRSQIFALFQKKTARKEIASIVDTSEATLSRELKNNSTPSGKYIWTKAAIWPCGAERGRWRTPSSPTNWFGESRNISSMTSGLQDKYQVICARMRG